MHLHNQQKAGPVVVRPMPIQVRKVTRENYVIEFNAIKHALNGTDFNIVTIDTDYPGQIRKSGQPYPQNPTSYYQLMKENVDSLKLIQVGLTVSNTRRNLPDFKTNYVFVWEILLDFDQRIDDYQRESIMMLQSQGVDFEENAKMGISPEVFRDRLFWSGLARPANANRTLVTYNGAYDLGYMVKVLTQAPLPNTLPDFMSLVRELFGRKVLDVKHLTTRLYSHIRGGLDEIARQLGVVPVVVPGHRTVTNALVTLQVYYKIRTSPSSSAGPDEEQPAQIHNLTN